MRVLQAATVLAMTLGSAVAPALGAQSAPGDTVVIPDRQLFHRSDLYVAGAFALATVALLPADRHLAELARDEDLLANGSLKKLSRDVRFFGGPGPFIIGGTMYAVGRLGHVPRMAELALHGTEAVVAGSTVAGVIKVLAGRNRPYVSNDASPHDFSFLRGFKSDSAKSFPSGHATAAFSAAAAVVAETHEWWPKSTWYVAPIMFGGATAVGLSRMYDNQHWASDVVMGAAIGTFAGLKTVRFNHTHAGNKIDQVLLGARLVPTPNGTAVGYSLKF
ncbi:MAG: phosphoesterase PA-phosphatase related protein [Gemmatimonadetes bacterium]|jgi:membrane-associated phospholipid phosphatase|nr:phosphoesterase PA-phosphatase related protein [Gemmatimonadota bacterium]